MLDFFLQQKLRDLMAGEGFTEPEELIDTDSFGRQKAYAICVNRGCYFTDRIDLEQTDGICDQCETDTMMNAVIAANCGWSP